MAVDSPARAPRRHLMATAALPINLPSRGFRYETLKACEDFFTETIPRWSVLVVDEAHHLKNEGGGLSRSLSRLTVNYRLLLTGTPLQNNLHELWALLHFILPDYFTSSESFDETIDVANQSVDANRLENARRLLTHFMLRRTKEARTTEPLRTAEENLRTTEHHTSERRRAPPMPSELH